MSKGHDKITLAREGNERSKVLDKTQTARLKVRKKLCIGRYITALNEE